MIVAVVLLGYALLLGTACVAVLRRAGWVDRAPRLAIVAWQAVSVSAVLAVVFGGVALMMPTLQLSSGLAGLLAACVEAVQAQYATPGGAVVSVIGVAVALGVLARCVYCLVRTFATGAAARRRQHRVLALLGRRHRWPDVTLLEHGQPVVYCVAGRPHRIVLTTGADRVLDEAQLAAVLAHERAHLRGRHHLAIGAASALARAFSWVGLFRHARDEIARLVELLADDAARGPQQRLVLAEAMLALAAQAPPAGALAARGSVAAGRVRRLIGGHRPLGAARTALTAAVAAAVLAFPAAVLATPAAMAGPECCPPSSAMGRHATEECLSARAAGTCPY